MYKTIREKYRSIPYLLNIRYPCFQKTYKCYCCCRYPTMIVMIKSLVVCDPSREKIYNRVN